MSAIETAISEIFDAFKGFICRDSLYVIGGVSVLLAIQHCFGGPVIELKSPSLIYICFLGYIVGYALQEMLSIAGFVTTGYRKLGRIRLFFARRFAPDESWDDIPDPGEIRLGSLRNCVDKHCPEDTKKRIDRTINLKHLGASGASFLVAALILFIDAYRHQSEPWIFPLACSTFFLAVSLALMSHIKGAQQRLMELHANQHCTQCESAK